MSKPSGKQVQGVPGHTCSRDSRPPSWRLSAKMSSFMCCTRPARAATCACMRLRQGQAGLTHHEILSGLRFQGAADDPHGLPVAHCSSPLAGSNRVKTSCAMSWQAEMEP